MTKKKKIALGVLIVFVLIQFIRIDKTLPVYTADNDILYNNTASIEVQNMLYTSCYDCHGNTTTYPWYSNIAPVSWWMQRHIVNARASLNFSEWETYTADEKAHAIEESILKVEKGWMPITSYKIMHSESKLDEEQTAVLMEWFSTVE